MDANKIFEEVAKHNLWGDVNSKSGPGSNLVQTKIIRQEIPALLISYNIKSMIDAPCGDFFWMKEIIGKITAHLDTYIGIDIVAGLIKKNNAAYANDKVKFIQTDIINHTPPKADLVLTRDCLLHLSYRNIYKLLLNLKLSGSTYILLSTYTDKKRKNKNSDDFFLHGRALNMEKFPFFLGTPLHVINEGCTEGNGAYVDKSLALWKLNSLALWKLKLYLNYLSALSMPLRIKNKITHILTFR